MDGPGSVDGKGLQDSPSFAATVAKSGVCRLLGERLVETIASICWQAEMMQDRSDATSARENCMHGVKRPGLETER
ncbi:hypothetical protein ACFWBS_53140 [Streptomyces mirabilis]|uniref:hypothetical protein n=1 Tax=Streptomyces mirabilis TaxID=68239 RepID=UPI00364D2633